MDIDPATSWWSKNAEGKRNSTNKKWNDQWNKKIDGEAEKANVADGSGKVELGRLQINGQRLLTNLALLKLEANSTEVQFQALMGQMDRTLVGEYTNYAITQAFKRDSFCEAVNQCGGDSKKARSRLDAIDRKVKSFEEFKSDFYSGKADAHKAKQAKDIDSGTK